MTLMAALSAVGQMVRYGGRLEIEHRGQFFDTALASGQQPEHTQPGLIG